MNIKKSYISSGRKHDVLNGVNFSISSGEFVSISGRSGSGKTTLVNIIAGLTRPTSGTVLLDGKDLSSMSDRETAEYRNTVIGCVPQGYSALSNLTILDNVRLPLHLLHNDNDSAEKARNMLTKFQIETLADSFPKTLSGGELKRMAIARAMINRPALLLADEPTGDIDEKTTRTIMEIFRKAAEENMAVLMITHDPELIKHTDKNFLMDGGVLVPQN